MRIIRATAQSRRREIVIRTVDGPVGLEADHVLYVEVMAHYVIYHTAEKAYRVRASMKEHEDTLKRYNFARCHKSYLINLQHLEGPTATEVRVADLSLPLGRAYKDALLNDYMKYLHR